MTQPSEEVTITTPDDGVLIADHYPGGDEGVCLFHGKRFDRHIWRPFALELQAQGYTVLAPDFRGYHDSRPGEAGTDRFDLDCQGTIEHMRAQAPVISCIAASMAVPALLEGLCALYQPIRGAVLLSPAWEPPSGYDCLKNKLAHALVWYGQQEKFQPACAAVSAHLPCPVVIERQDSGLHAHAYFDDPKYAPQLKTAIFRFLESETS